MAAYDCWNQSPYTCIEIIVIIKNCYDCWSHLSVLQVFADEDKGLDQYAIRKFAEALDVVPRTLAENSGCDPTNIMHTLHLSHSSSNGGVGGAEGRGEMMGFDIEECQPINTLDAGIFDIYATKVNAFR